MRFIEIIIKKKLTLTSICLCLYVTLNLFDGERGLISFFEKHNIKKELLKEKKLLSLKLDLLEKKNMLLTEKIDHDYIETLYREKFLIGKSNESIYKNE
jgi:hypothetical protein